MAARAKTTSERIRAAARKLFLKKGYSQTSVRDIASEAGINLASMNYHFRSKESLFEIIMMEYVSEFFHHITLMLDREDLTSKEKVELFVENYTSLMLKQPEVPMFVLSELRTRPDSFARQLGVKGVLFKLRFFSELKQAQKARPAFNPVQLFLSLIGMTIFPFIGRPMLQAVAGLSQKQFIALMEERKKLIPIWFEKMIQ